MGKVQKSEPIVDLGRSAVSRYIQLATLFRRRIDSGVWPAGEQIPTIDELVAETGVARATVRQALGMLETDGMLARFRAKGTFVLERKTEGLWCEVESDWQGLLNGRPGAKIEVVSSTIVTAPANPPKEMGALAESYRHLHRVHSRDGRRFLLADVYVATDLAKGLPASAFSTRTAMRLAESLPGVEIADARQTLSIGSADVETASALDIPLNAPVAYVQRSVVDQHGQLVLLANGTYRGDVVRMDIKLR